VKPKQIHLTDLEISELSSELEGLEVISLSIAADTTLNLATTEQTGEQTGEQTDEKV